MAYMSKTAESMPSVIDTVPRAAEEFRRLHSVLGAQAVELTGAYLAAKRAGTEGASWRWSPHLVAERLPILDPVMRVGDSIELGPYLLPLNERATRLRLTGTGEPGSSLLIERPGVGLYKPGEKYWVRGNDISEADYASQPIHAPWAEGLPVTLTTLSHDSYTDIDPADAEAFTKLTKLIADISFYETLVVEA